MAKHNFNAVLATSPGRYHKAKKGGNKDLINSCEKHRYSNEYLLGKEYIKHNNNKLNKRIMAKKNLLTSGLGVNVLRGVRTRMFNDFCESLLDSLVSSASGGCGVGRLTYAALISVWRKDTVNCAYVLNESEGRKLFNADNNDSRVRRLGVEGHWSFFVSPSASAADLGKETDSITVLVGGWLRSWSSWFDSVVCFGHYGDGGVPAASSITAGLLNRCRGLWSYRGVGGRVAATSAEKAQKKVAKAVAGLSSAELLAALRASGVDLAALVGGGAPQTEDNNKKE